MRLTTAFLAGLILTALTTVGAQAGYWTGPIMPDDPAATPVWGGTLDPAFSSINPDDSLRIDTSDNMVAYHSYDLLGPDAVTAGADFATSDSIAWRVRMEETPFGAQRTASVAVYAPSPVAGKSDLYVIRMKDDAIGVGHPYTSAPWYALDMTEWHNFKMDIDPVAQSGQLFVDDVSFGNVLVYKDKIPLNPYNGIRWGDQSNETAGISDWAYVGWGADGQVPVAQFPNATDTTVIPYDLNAPREGDFVEIALPTDSLKGNRRASHTAYSTMPVGDVTLRGVPFSIPTDDGNTVANYWDSRYDSEGAAVDHGELNQIVIDVNQEGVSDVYTLINTYAGASGEPALAKLIFEATDGTIYEYELLGNRDIRDAVRTSSYTTTLDPNHAGQGWAGTGGSYQVQLDVQKVSLPAEFADKTLATVTLQDWGTMAAGDHRQRSWFYGMTVETVPVPEPSTLVLLLGIAAITTLTRRRGS